MAARRGVEAIWTALLARPRPDGETTTCCPRKSPRSAITTGTGGGRRLRTDHRTKCLSESKATDRPSRATFFSSPSPFSSWVDGQLTAARDCPTSESSYASTFHHDSTAALWCLRCSPMRISSNAVFCPYCWYFFSALGFSGLESEWDGK
uniref:Uncharacterized protein n=1 Tax=Plectus sambesii TaxID=2011161 RepID=A0A914XHG2_9BILA